MTTSELLELLEVGENTEIECKKSKTELSKSLWETYSAFANTNGGVILLGILEDKKTKKLTVDGIDNINNQLKLFWDTINNKQKVSLNILKDDDVTVVKVDECNVICVKVPRAKRTDKPIYLNGNPMTGTFKRFHEGDYHATTEEIKIMFADATFDAKDIIEIDEFNISDIDSETLEDYRASFKVHNGESHKYNKLSNEDFLYTINAANRDSKKLTMAGLLMFGRDNDIRKIFTSYQLDYREIKDKNTERWSHRILSTDVNFAGNLWSFFSKIVNKLTSDIEIPFALNKKMQRIDDTDIHKSVREALSNCLVHADYRESGSIVVIKGNNYFKFANPGNLRIPLEQALLGGRSDPRNPNLHLMFAYLGYGEKAGSGLPMIISSWNERNWISPKIAEVFNPNRTTLELYMNTDTNETQEIIIVTSEYQPKEKIYEVIKNNDGITRKALVENLGFTEAQVKYSIDLLKKENRITTLGKSKNITYHIKK